MPGCVGGGGGSEINFSRPSTLDPRGFFLDVNMILETEHSLNFQKL